MRLAISNIAWDPVEDEVVASLLRSFDIDAIDVAPGKYFPDPSTATTSEIQDVRTWWSTRGFEISGMQALLFGTSGLNLFGPAPVQDAMLQHLSHVCRIGAGLGASRLVFGSPKNRDRGGLDERDALGIACGFFSRLGDIAASHGVLICLEPNPERYGSNFMVSSEETARVVTAVAHPAIRMQLDTGALTIKGEDPSAVLRDFAPLIGHVHASEPDLVPLGDGGCDHEGMGHAIARYLPNHLVSIEMLATKEEQHVDSIARALSVATLNYQRHPSRYPA